MVLKIVCAVAVGSLVAVCCSLCNSIEKLRKRMSNAELEVSRVSSLERYLDTERSLRAGQVADMKAAVSVVSKKVKELSKRQDGMTEITKELLEKQAEMEGIAKERAEQEQKFYEGVNNILDYSVMTARKAGDE